MITDLAREGIWPTMTYVVDKNTEIDADDDKDRNVVKEVVPPRTYFTRRVLDKFCRSGGIVTLGCAFVRSQVCTWNPLLSPRDM